MAVKKSKRKNSWVVFNGEALEVLKKISDNKFHAIVTDPPAGISFMGKAWDRDRGGRDAWIEWLTEIMVEVHRVLRPGGYALVWALPRTSHWTATAVEDAGFEIRDRIHDLASADCALASFLDSLDSSQREALGRIIEGQGASILSAMFGTGMPKGFLKGDAWKGYGTGLKPVMEHWILAQKPLACSSTAANLDEFQTGALHVDACRVAVHDDAYAKNCSGDRGHDQNRTREQARSHRGALKTTAGKSNKLGRYPPHLLLSHAPGCELVGEKRVKTGKAHRKKGGKNFGSETRAKPPMEDMTYGDASGNETVPEFRCVPGCPIGIIDAQAGPAGSNGSAGGYSMGHGYKGLGKYGARTKPVKATKGAVTRFWPTFLYEPKASVKEKNAGCEDLDPRDWREGTKNSTPRSGQIFEEYGRKGKPRPNSHPTVKAAKLMRWLVRLLTFPGGLILDPFAGSGTTGVAATLEGMRFVGIEQDGYYCEIARRRLKHAEGERDAARRRDQDQDNTKLRRDDAAAAPD